MSLGRLVGNASCKGSFVVDTMAVASAKFALLMTSSCACTARLPKFSGMLLGLAFGFGFDFGFGLGLVFDLGAPLPFFGVGLCLPVLYNFLAPPKYQCPCMTPIASLAKKPNNP